MTLVLPESLEIHDLILFIIHLYHIPPLSGSLILCLGLLFGKPPVAFIIHDGLGPPHCGPPFCVPLSCEPPSCGLPSCGPTRCGPPSCGPPSCEPPSCGPTRRGSPSCGPPSYGPPSCEPPFCVPPSCGPPVGFPPWASILEALCHSLGIVISSRISISISVLPQHPQGAGVKQMQMELICGPVQMPGQLCPLLAKVAIHKEGDSEMHVAGCSQQPGVLLGPF